MKPHTPSPEKRRTHYEAILELLSDGKEHSSMELARVGGLNYRARVSNLRGGGYIIKCEPGIGGVNFYRLVGRKAQMELKL